MKLGVKSEIHDATIEIAKFLEENKILPEEFSRILEEDKELRIDNQYYLKNRKVDLNIERLREFILTMKDKVNTVTSNEITEIRKKLVKFQKS